MKELLPCGTNAGYARHIKKKEVPCKECKEAHSKDVKNAYKKPKLMKRCGTLAGIQRHKRAGERVCEACTAAYREYRKQWEAARKAKK